MGLAGNSGRRGGFSLLELLAIVAIVLILAIAIMPNIGAGFSGTQLATASRSMLQAAKFARTMALLHQVEMELVLTSANDGAGNGNADGQATIEVRLRSSNGSWSAAPEDADFPDDDAPEVITSPEDGFQDDEFGEGAENAAKTAAQSTGAAMEGFAGEVHSTIKCGSIVFEFLRFTEDEEDDDLVPQGGAATAATADMGGGGMVSDNQISLVFDSDGTCRPFEVLLRDGEEGDCNIIKIDRWGKGVAEPYEK